MEKPKEHNIASKLPQILAASAATFGAFSTGLGLSWSSPALPYIANCGDQCTLSEDLGKEVGSWIASIFNIGCAISCLITGYLMSVIGRKWTLIVMVIPFTVGWILLLITGPLDLTNPWWFYIGRLLTGIGAGAFTLGSPIYISEVSETSIRGALSSLMQLQSVLGGLFNNGVGALIDWTSLTAICLACPIIMAAMMFFMPESPYFLLMKGREEEARKSLQWLRGKHYDISEEFEAMRRDQKEQEEIGTISIKELLTKPEYLKPLLIMLMMMFYQQFSGVNSVIFYLTEIFIKAGVGLDPGLSATLINVVQTLTVLLSVFIIERSGRRILVIVSCLGSCVSILALGTFFFLDENRTELCYTSLEPFLSTTSASTSPDSGITSPVPCILNEDGYDPDLVDSLGWLPLVSLMVYIFAFSIGLGPIPWVMNGEFFPLEAKAVASTTAGVTNWMSSFIISKFTTNLEDLIEQSGTYFLFGAICFTGAFFVGFIVPETKGKTPDDMKRHFMKDK